MSGKRGLDALRATLVGYSQGDLCAIAEEAGYVYVREARHGKLYRHPELADHPDVEIRKRYTYLVIQKGGELKAGAARDLRDRLELLETLGDNDGKDS